MNKYKVDWVENKRSATTQKEFQKLVLIDASGAKEEVSVWSEFPGYPFTAGDEVMGEIVIKGNYKNLVATSPSTSPRAGGFKGGGNRGAEVAAAQERKEGSIERFQETKEVSIKVAAAMRDATIIVTELFPDLTQIEDLDARRKEIKAEWAYWRDFFLNQHDLAKEGKPF